MMLYIKHKIWQVHNADELYETSVSNTDTKAAARQSPNCIKKTKINQIWRKTIFNMADGIFTPCNHDHVIARSGRSWHWFHQVTGLTAPCDVACGSGIVTVAVPCNVIRSSLMTCHWIRPTSAILVFYIWFWFRPITAVEMSFCISLRTFIQIGPPSAEKNDCHVNFQDGRSL